MKKYQAVSERYSSKICLTLEEALKEYEDLKEWEITNEPDEDSYVNLYEDNEINNELIRRSVIAEDEVRMAEGDPRSEGFDFDYWAKWVEVL